MAWTPLSLARKAAEALSARGIEDGRLEAELLLADALGIGRLDLYLQHDRPLTEAEVATYREMVRRRMRREPLQYITGRARFRELTLSVDHRVLIPRPETETLVEAVLGWARERTGAEGAEGSARGLTALDVGTGSGAIALSLLVEGPFERVIATDVSADALAVAEANARSLGLGERLEFRRGDLWAPVHAGEVFDVVVSNPPYVAESDRPGLPPEVRDWEPAVALHAGDDGLAVLLGLVAGAPARLRPGGLLALEVGAGQAQSVAAAIAANPAYHAPRVVPDLAGRERVVLATVAALAKRNGEADNA